MSSFWISNFIKIRSPVLKLKIPQFFWFFQINNPQLPQRGRIRTNYVNLVSITCAYSSYQVSSGSLHSKVSPKFPVSKISVSPLQPSMSPDPIRIENAAAFKTWDLSIYKVSLRLEHGFPRDHAHFVISFGFNQLDSTQTLSLKCK